MSQLVQTPLWPFQARELDIVTEKPRTILGWDMGTGKTLGAIERDLRLRTDTKIGQTLIVAPGGTHYQWAKAIERETGEEAYVIDRKDRPATYKAGQRYVILHYEVLRLMPGLRGKYDHIVFDECHRLKGRKTKVSRAAKEMGFRYVTMMSGSPADDKPTDIWNLLHLMWPKSYRSFNVFYDQFIESELVRQNPRDPFSPVYSKITGIKPAWNGLELPKLIRNGLFSRVTIDEALPHLPPKIYEDVYVDLYPVQRAHYEEFNEEMITWVRDQEDELQPLIATAVIAKLQRLQQFALATLTYNTETGKYAMALPSAKIDWVMEKIIDESTQQFVVFSQFKAPLILLQQQLTRAGITSVMYTGDTKNTRDAGRVAFSQGRVRVFLATMSAGGEGVDGLQTLCRNMIFLDRSWRPLHNDQAEARLRRGGQVNKVQIYNLLAKDTIDFDRNVTIERKKQWVLRMLGDI